MTQSTKESKTLASLWLTMLIVLSLDFTEAPALQRGSLKDRAEPQPSWHGPASSSAPRPCAQQQLGSPILTPYEGQASCVQVLLIAGCIGLDQALHQKDSGAARTMRSRAGTVQRYSLIRDPELEAFTFPDGLQMGINA